MVKIIHGERIGKLGKLVVSCTAVIFDETRQRILLTQRQDNQRWCLPGGHMEAGESAAEACIREVWEETGLRVDVERLVHKGKDISTIEWVRGVIARFWEEDHVLVRKRVEPLFLCPGS